MVWNLHKKSCLTLLLLPFSVLSESWDVRCLAAEQTAIWSSLKMSPRTSCFIFFFIWMFPYNRRLGRILIGTSRCDGVSVCVWLQACPRPRPWRRRTTRCAASWTPTGTRWSCWSRSRARVSRWGARRTARTRSSSASCSRLCRACRRYHSLSCSSQSNVPASFRKSSGRSG